MKRTFLTINIYSHLCNPCTKDTINPQWFKLKQGQTTDVQNNIRIFLSRTVCKTGSLRYIQNYLRWQNVNLHPSTHKRPTISTWEWLHIILLNQWCLFILVINITFCKLWKLWKLASILRIHVQKWNKNIK